MLIRFVVRVCREWLSNSVCTSFPYGFEGGTWDMIVYDFYYILSFY